MKKIISLVMSIVFIGLPLYGCQANNKPDVVTEDTTPETTDEDSTITPNENLPTPNTTGDTATPPGNTTTTPPTNNTTNPQPPVNNNTTNSNDNTTDNNTNKNNDTAKAPATGDTTRDVNQASGNLVTDILNSTNSERSKQGLDPLKLNSEVSKLAALKSKDMYDKNYFSHTSPTYGDPGKMLTDNGLRYAAMGENIYTSTGMTPTGTYTVQQWMNSPGHRANILSTNYDEIGIGVYYSNGKYYATQIFYRD